MSSSEENVAGNRTYFNLHHEWLASTSAGLINDFVSSSQLAEYSSRSVKQSFQRVLYCKYHVINATPCRLSTCLQFNGTIQSQTEFHNFEKEKTQLFSKSPVVKKISYLLLESLVSIYLLTMFVLPVAGGPVRRIFWLVILARCIK